MRITGDGRCRGRDVERAVVEGSRAEETLKLAYPDDLPLVEKIRVHRHADLTSPRDIADR